MFHFALGRVPCRPWILTQPSLDISRPAEAVAGVLGLGTEVSTPLQVFPHKTWSRTIPTDPVIYCAETGVLSIMPSTGQGAEPPRLADSISSQEGRMQ
jgi:cyanate lyase